MRGTDRQTHTQTDTHTDGPKNSIVAHFVGATITMGFTLFQVYFVLSSTKYIINVYITEYAYFEYFDLELHDLDLDPWAIDINHVLSSSTAYNVKKGQF